MTLACDKATFIFTRRKAAREGPSLSRVPWDIRTLFSFCANNRGQGFKFYQPFDERRQEQAFQM